MWEFWASWTLFFIQFEKALQVHDTLLYDLFLCAKDHSALETATFITAVPDKIAFVLKTVKN